jgi:hypothetical protein
VLQTKGLELDSVQKQKRQQDAGALRRRNSIQGLLYARSNSLSRKMRPGIHGGCDGILTWIVVRSKPARAKPACAASTRLFLASRAGHTLRRSLEMSGSIGDLSEIPRDLSGEFSDEASELRSYRVYRVRESGSPIGRLGLQSSQASR